MMLSQFSGGGGGVVIRVERTVVYNWEYAHENEMVFQNV
jgi:hypothetical protein